MISIETLPMLLKSIKFQKICQTKLQNYKEVNLLIYINNIEFDPLLTQSIKLYENNFI